MTATDRVVGYRAAHMRVQAARGHASSYPCAGECGQPASDWAYNHDDPAELVATVNGSRCYYSLASDFYKPLCRPCHLRFDRAQRALRIIATW